MRRGVFVTGSDTGVGKTVVSAALCLGLGAEYWKPIQSGLEGPTDAECVAALAGLTPERVAPSRFVLDAPRSPHEAAARQGVAIRLADFSLPDPSRPGAPIVVEGAGGAMVPLNERDLMVDLMARLGLPVVLVVRAGLGTINHALLSLAALRAAGLDIAGAVMVGEPDAANREAIERYGRVEVLAEIPPLDPLRRETLTPFAEFLAARLDRALAALSAGRGAGHASTRPDQGESNLGGSVPAPGAGSVALGESAARPRLDAASPRSPSPGGGASWRESPPGWLGERSPLGPGSPEKTGALSGAGGVLEKDRRHVWRPFTQAQTAPPPIEIASGRGAWLRTADGRRLLDTVSSWWVNMHGHAHPKIVEAVARQAGTIEQALFADFTHAPAVELASRLAGLLPGDLARCFFSDNGSTAVEVSLKIAIQYWRNRGEPKRARIAAMEGGYHGDTFGAMAAGRGSGYFAAFDPWLFAVETIPFPATFEGDADVEVLEARSLDAFRAMVRRHPGELAAIVVEPLVQGAAGMRMCRPGYLRQLVEEARAAGALVVFDEVMTGFGRTGEMFACLKAEVAPDVVCLSKGLTGGFLPMSVTMCREEIHAAFLGESFDKALAHGHSYTANPLGCAAALASLDLFGEEDYPRRAAMIEAVHRRNLPRLADLERSSRPWTAKRGRICGTIAAFDAAPRSSATPAYGAPVSQAIKRYCLEREIYVRPMGGVVYFMPPYCIAEDELQRAWDVVLEAVSGLA